MSSTPKLAPISRITKPKTKRGARILKNKASLTVENDKNTLLFKRPSCGEIVSGLLQDIHTLKQPLIQTFPTNHTLLPFEDSTFIEAACRKYDCSLFALGSHSKKRPHNLVLGRMFQHEILDMYEFGGSDFTKFGGETARKLAVTHAAKPALFFTGFEQNSKLLFFLKSFFIDFFQGGSAKRINRAGVRSCIHFIAEDAHTPALSSSSSANQEAASQQTIRMRTYQIEFAGSSSSLSSTTTNQEDEEGILSGPPGVISSGVAPLIQSARELGPSVVLSVRRSRLPASEMWKRAMQRPAPPSHTAGGSRGRSSTPKQVHTDELGNVKARIFVDNERLENLIQPRKQKGGMAGDTS